MIMETGDGVNIRTHEDKSKGNKTKTSTSTSRIRRRSSSMRTLTDEAITVVDEGLKLPAMNDREVVSQDARITFLLIEANAAAGLTANKARNTRERKELEKICKDNYQLLIDQCAKAYQPYNSIRLQVSIQFSLFLHDICHNREWALEISRNAYVASLSFVSKMNEIEINTLNILREIYSYIDENIALEIDDNISMGSTLPPEEEQEQERNGVLFNTTNNNNDMNAGVGAGGGVTYTKSIGSISTKASMSMSVGALMGYRSRGKSIQDVLSITSRSNDDDLMNYVKQIQAKAVSSYGDTYQIKNLNHGNEIETALQTIFDSYVKGNAVSASIVSGDQVNVNQKPYSLGDFALEGPFITWDGFTSLAHDFCICSKKDDMGNRLPSFRPNEDFIVNQRNLAILFMVSACTDIPVVYTPSKLYKDPKQDDDDNHTVKEMKSTMSGYTLGSMTSRSTVKKPDVWGEYAISAAKQSRVYGSIGLNFAQFVDCLARCGMVGFSDNPNFNYDDMYPTEQDKVKAVFSTHMGLTDERYWNAILVARRSVKM